MIGDRFDGCEPGLKGPVRAGLAEEKKNLREKAQLACKAAAEGLEWS